VSGRLALLALLLTLALAVAIAAGSTGWQAPWSASDVVLALRAPRAVLAAIVGAALAVAGVAMQAVVRNPLAEPYVLGMSGGAAAGAVLALSTGLPAAAGAALGATLAVVAVRAMCRGVFAPARLLLTGVTVGALAASVAGIAIVLSPGQRLLRSAEAWLFGGIAPARWTSIAAAAALMIAAVAWGWRRAASIDRLSLGDDLAAALGADVTRTRRALLALSVALTACAVALAGVVGFVGLIAPHAARLLVGAGHRALVPAAALVGAAGLVIADTVARTAFAPRELPIGLVTAVIGAPCFLWLARRELA
jgi:iron complex transport system permease protein